MKKKQTFIWLLLFLISFKMSFAQKVERYNIKGALLDSCRYNEWLVPLNGDHISLNRGSVFEDQKEIKKSQKRKRSYSFSYSLKTEKMRKFYFNKDTLFSKQKIELNELGLLLVIEINKGVFVLQNDQILTNTIDEKFQQLLMKQVKQQNSILNNSICKEVEKWKIGFRKLFERITKKSHSVEDKQQKRQSIPTARSKDFEAQNHAFEEAINRWKRIQKK